MTKRTRVFMAAAVGVLVLGVGVGLVAMYANLPVLAQFGDRAQSELAYLPQDVRLVAFANVRDVMDSELRQKVLQLRPAPAPAQPDGAPPPDGPPPDAPGRGNDFFRQAGIDLETDVDSVFVCLAGPADAEDDRPLVLARGRFDDDLIETLLRERGGQVEQYRGVRLLTHREGDSPQMLGLAFVEPDLVAFGSAASVRQAIDVKQGAAPNLSTNEEVMTLVRGVNDGNAWTVGRFDAVAGRTPLPREVTSRLPPISWFSARGHINGGLDGVIRVETRDAAAGQDLREVLQGFLALARLQAGQLEQYRGLINSIDLGGQGTTVSVTFTVPSSAIDALAALRNERRGAGVPSLPAPGSPSQEAPPNSAQPSSRPPRT